jgi:NTE family protein
MKFFDLFKKKKLTLDDIKNGKSYKRNKKVRVGLALGGGGARGFAHLGAIKAFEEYGIHFDYISGTSVGSLVGALYASGMKYEDMLNIALAIREKDIKTSKIPLMPSKTNGIQDIIINNLGDINVQDLKTPFCAVAVDIKSTNEVHIRKGNLAKAVAGSCCVPTIFVPVEFEDMLLCDGGLQNTIPSEIPKEYGCDYVVGIDVNPCRAKGTNSTKILDVINVSINIMMKSNALHGYKNADIMIQPDTERFSSSKFEGFEEMIEEGYRATISRMPEILELFSKKPDKKKDTSKSIFKGYNKLENEQDVRVLKYLNVFHFDKDKSKQDENNIKNDENNNVNNSVKNIKSNNKANEDDKFKE